MKKITKTKRYYLFALIAILLGVLMALKLVSVNNDPSQETLKTFCEEEFCIDYNNLQIKIREEFKSNDIEIFSFDQIGDTPYLDETPLMSLRIVASKTSSIKDYIVTNQNYCDEVIKSAEEAGMVSDCHRFTTINQDTISGNNFAKVHESGGGGSVSSLDFLILHNSKVYEFSCNPSNEQELEWLDIFDIEKLKIFESSKTFETCLNLISSFSFTK